MSQVQRFMKLIVFIWGNAITPYWDVRSVQIPRLGTVSIALSQVIR
jgi:hypothetical protein